MKKLIVAYLLSTFSNLIIAQNFDVSGDINTKGKIKINGVAGQTGQVLTSNGPNASPEWANLSNTNPTPTEGFRLRNNRRLVGPGDFQVGSGIDALQTVPLELVEVHDFNNLISLGNDFTITFNKEGVYHLEGQLQFSTTGKPELPDVYTPFSLVRLTEKQTITSNPETLIVKNEALHQTVSTNVNRIYRRSSNWSYEGFFKAGATLIIEVGFENLAQSSTTALITLLKIENTGSYVTGYLMSK